MVLFSCSTVPNYLSFDEALENALNRVENDLPEGSDIAILDFKSDNPNLSSYIIEELYDKLVNNRKLSIMERSRIDTIAIEVGYQLSGEVDDKEIISIGHQLGADYVVTGQITFSGEAYRLRVFAIDIEKGRRIASSSLNINSNDRQINYLLSSEYTVITQTYNVQNPEVQKTISINNLIGTWDFDQRGDSYNFRNTLVFYADGNFSFFSNYYYSENSTDRMTAQGTWTATAEYITIDVTVSTQINSGNLSSYSEKESFSYGLTEDTLWFNTDFRREGFVLRMIGGSFKKIRRG